MPELEPVQNPETCESDSKLSRRDFARSLALAATAAVVVPGTVLSQESAPKPNPAPGAGPQPTAQLSPALQAEGELKYQWIIQNYGDRLTDAEKQDVHRLVMEGQKPLPAFRAFPLDNADQPATVLKFTDAELASERSKG
jgi:hypothetical protein